jgi:hypothetical protein
MISGYATAGRSPYINKYPAKIPVIIPFDSNLMIFRTNSKDKLLMKIKNNQIKKQSKIINKIKLN